MRSDKIGKDRAAKLYELVADANTSMQNVEEVLLSLKEDLPEAGQREESTNEFYNELRELLIAVQKLAERAGLD